MPDQEKIQKPTCNVVVFENRFPSLSPNPSEPATRLTELYPVRPARGKCELVVYTSPHNSTLANEPGGYISDFEF